jgi:hypothetical protein
MADLSPRPDPLAPTPTARPPLGTDAPSAPPPVAPGGDTGVEEVTVTAEKKPDAPKLSAQGLANKYQETEEKLAAVDEASGALQPPKWEMPPPPKPKYTNPVEAWGSAAMLLAGVGSLLTRAPLTTALNSAAGVMNAIHQGDVENAELQFSQWKTATDMAQKQLNFQNDAYKTALQKAKGDKQEALAALNSYSAAFGHTAVAEAAKARDLNAAKRLIIDQARLTNQMAKDAPKIEQGYQFMRAKKELMKSEKWQKADETQRTAMLADIMPGQSYPQEVVDFYAAQLNKTGKIPPMGMKSGLRDRVLIAAAHQAVAASGGKDAQGAAGDVVAGQAGVKSDALALNQIKKISTASAAYENTALRNMGLVEKLMPVGAATDLGPYLNSWVQSGRVETGDKAAPAYITSVLTVANEYAKVMSGATGAAGSTVDSRREAAEMISANHTRDQLRNVFKVMRADMMNKVRSYNDMGDALKNAIANGDQDEMEPGTVVDGFIYYGGDQGDPGNWGEANE